MKTIKFAAEHYLLVAVRGGGHNVAGRALCDGGVVTDVSDMRGVFVDPTESTCARREALHSATSIARPIFMGWPCRLALSRKPGSPANLGRRRWLAGPSLRADLRQCRGFRSGHRRGRVHDGQRDPESGPVLGAPWRRRQFPSRNLVHISSLPGLNGHGRPPRLPARNGSSCAAELSGLPCHCT
jgi:hypothetical protein